MLATDIDVSEDFVVESNRLVPVRKWQGTMRVPGGALSLSSLKRSTWHGHSPSTCPPVDSTDKNQINLRPLIDPGCRALGKCWQSLPPSPLPPPYPLLHLITHYGKFKCDEGGEKRDRVERVGLEFLHLMRRAGDETLLRGEMMRSGRRHSKINHINLSGDREISLTVRALVRAKWSEVGGDVQGGDRPDLRSGRNGKQNFFCPFQAYLKMGILCYAHHRGVACNSTPCLNV